MFATSAEAKAIVQVFLACNDDFYNHCCSQARATGKCPYGLTEQERVAVWIYSSTDENWYTTVNSELRGPKTASPAVQNFAKLLNQALAKLPAFDGLVYRGMVLGNLDDYVPYYVEGSVIRWDAFTSTSSDREKAFSGNALFIIQSHTGRCLGDYADKPEENEILFMSHTYFRVIGSERIDEHFIVFLEEVVP